MSATSPQAEASIRPQPPTCLDLTETNMNQIFGLMDTRRISPAPEIGARPAQSIPSLGIGRTDIGGRIAPAAAEASSDETPIIGIDAAGEIGPIDRIPGPIPIAAYAWIIEAARAFIAPFRRSAAAVIIGRTRINSATRSA